MPRHPARLRPTRPPATALAGVVFAVFALLVVATARTTGAVTFPTPSVTGISPTTGPATGGTSVTIAGANFPAGSTVSFGGIAAGSVTVAQDGSAITATTPAHASGAVAVAIGWSEGTLTLFNAFTYAAITPSLTGISPATGHAAGGTAVTITGQNFDTAATVTIGGAAATGVTVNQAGTSIAAVTPPGTAGAADVVVTNPSAVPATLTGAFTYTAAGPAPVLTALSPVTVAEGSATFTLTVDGAGFASGATVRWNGAARTTTFVSATRLTAQIPGTDIATPATAAITVSNPDATVSGSMDFTITVCNRECTRTGPSLTSLSPPSTQAGGSSFALTVNGGGFTSGTLVLWNGSVRATTFVSATKVTATISGIDIGTPGTATIRAVNADGSASGTLPFTVEQCQRNCPAGPSITLLDPSSVAMGSGAFTLTVNGANFQSGATVNWNGAPRTTTFVNATKLTAAISASDVVSAGTAAIVVSNPGGASSPAATFTITPPPPVLTSISPTNVIAGAAALTLTLTGSNFVNGVIVRWAGSDRPTAFVSATQLTAQIAAADVAVAGTFPVTVVNPGTVASAAQTFTVNNPVPTVTALNPQSTPAAGLPFTLTVDGANFVAGSVVHWNGAARTTTYVSATRLTAQITAADIAAPGSAAVTVFNAAPGGGLSNALTFTITQPVPLITSLSPAMRLINGGGFTLTLDGTSFVAGAQVYWNGMPRPTTYVSNTQLTAVIPAADVAATGAAAVSVINPDGSPSEPAQFRVCTDPDCPAIATAIPAAPAGGQPFTLTINGANFATGATVQWNGVAKTTTVVNSSQVTIPVQAADIATIGTAAITVVNPTNRGPVTSNTVEYRICGSGGCPVLGALDPNTANIGGSGFTLALTGRGFAAGATARWNGTARPTTFVSATRLTVAVSAADLAAAGSATLTVANPDGSTANPLTFRVVDCGRTCPTLTALSPAAAPAGGGPLPLTLTGTFFVEGALVRWRGVLRPATVVSATQLTVVLTAADLATAGPVTVTVVNPDGGVSNSMTFTVQ